MISIVTPPVFWMIYRPYQAWELSCLVLLRSTAVASYGHRRQPPSLFQSVGWLPHDWETETGCRVMLGYARRSRHWFVAFST